MPYMLHGRGGNLLQIDIWFWTLWTLDGECCFVKIMYMFIYILNIWVMKQINKSKYTIVSWCCILCMLYCICCTWYVTYIGTCTIWKRGKRSICSCLAYISSMCGSITIIYIGSTIGETSEHSALLLSSKLTFRNPTQQM